MEKTNNKSKKLLMTVIGIILVLCAWVGLTRCLGIIGGHFADSPLVSIVFPELSGGILLVGGIILAIHEKRMNVLKFTKKGFGTGLKVGLYFLIASGVTGLMTVTSLLSGSMSIKCTAFFGVLFSTFCIALREELLMRGLLQNRLHEFFGEDSPANIRKAIFFTGVGFGLIHLLNIIGGASLQGSLIQALVNIVQGMLYSAIYYRSGKNLWVCIFIHTVQDYVLFLASEGVSLTFAQSVSSYTVALFVPASIVLAIVLFATRKSVLAKCINSRKTGDNDSRKMDMAIAAA